MLLRALASNGVTMTRTTERRARWPRRLQRVRTSALPGTSWPHTTPWEWHVVRAHKGHRLVGYALLRVFFEGDVDFHDLAVHANHQREGCGTALCDEAIAWMRELECTEVSALPTSDESYRILVRCGFQPGPVPGTMVLRLR